MLLCFDSANTFLFNYLDQSMSNWSKKTQHGWTCNGVLRKKVALLGCDQQQIYWLLESGQHFFASVCIFCLHQEASCDAFRIMRKCACVVSIRQCDDIIGNDNGTFHPFQNIFTDRPACVRVIASGYCDRRSCLRHEQRLR